MRWPPPLPLVSTNSLYSGYFVATTESGGAPYSTLGAPYPTLGAPVYSVLGPASRSWLHNEGALLYPAPLPLYNPGGLPSSRGPRSGGPIWLSLSSRMLISAFGLMFFWSSRIHNGRGAPHASAEEDPGTQSRLCFILFRAYLFRSMHLHGYSAIYTVIWRQFCADCQQMTYFFDISYSF